MGLDISYYRGLTPVECSAEDGDCEHIRVRIDPSFAGRELPLTEGCYTATVEGDGFRAGSYSGYTMWRESLAELAGFPKIGAVVSDSPMSDHFAKSYPHSSSAFNGNNTDRPFYELIDFSDCEGTIGPIVSKKLAADFSAFDERAKAHFDDYGYQRYQNWRKAFEMASDGGAVCFH